MAQEEKKASQEEHQVVMSYGYAPYCPPHEEVTIDLRELMATLRRRKKTVIWTTLLVLFATMIYLWKAHPIYEAKATLEIGKQLIKKSDGSIEIKYFDDAKSLKQALDVKYDTAGKYRDKNTTAYIKSVSVPKKSDQFLTITALGLNNEYVTKILRRPINDVLKKHDIYYHAILRKRKDRIAALEKSLSYDEKVVLPQLETNLKILKTIGLKKIEDQIRLVKSIDLKKIEDKIETLKKVDIKSLQEKIKESQAEIAKKESAVESMRKKLQKISKTDPALAAITAMQIASLQNDIGALKIRIIDLKSNIQKIREESIPSLEKQKTKILQETIPNLEANKIRLLEETIPGKKAQINKMLSITIPNIKRSIEDVRASMKEPYLVMTKIVGKIYTHDKPVKPKKKLIIIVALITGLMMGIFLAFFREFLSQNKEN